MKMKFQLILISLFIGITVKSQDTISYISDTASSNCPSGIKFQNIGDSIKIYGTISVKGCGRHVAIISRESDSIFINTKEIIPPGEADCNIAYLACFGINIPKPTNNAILKFDGKIYNIYSRDTIPYILNFKDANCPSGINFQYIGDTLTISGKIVEIPCGRQVAVVNRINDTVLINIEPSGFAHPECIIMDTACFEVKLKTLSSDIIVNFNGIIYNLKTNVTVNYYEIDVNGTFQLALPAALFPGCGWFWTNKQPASIVDTVDIRFIPDVMAEIFIGTEIWKFKGKKVGTDTVKLEYKRSWETNSTIETRIIIVNVKAINSSNLIIKAGYTCGWGAGTDTIEISKTAIRYVYYIPKKSEFPQIIDTKTVPDSEWTEILKCVNIEDFVKLNYQTCNVCVDGCDEWISVQEGSIYHKITFDKGLTIDSIGKLQNIISQLRTEFNSVSNYVIFINDTFQLELPSNPSTGYSWVWINKQPGSIVDTSNNSFLPDNPIWIGSGGNEIWKFKGEKAGIDTVKLEYCRSWEANSTIETKIIIVNVEESNSIKSNYENAIIIYPNPTDGLLEIEFKDTNTKSYMLNIYDLNGVKILSKIISTPKSLIDIGSLKAGCYLVSTGYNNDVMPRKLIIKK